MSSFPTKSQFAAQVDSLFKLQADAGASLDLQLVELREGGTAEGQEKFSLLLDGPRDPLMPQRMYSLAHSDLGTIELFLVPIARDELGTRYEAVFTRLLNFDGGSKLDGGALHR